MISLMISTNQTRDHCMLSQVISSWSGIWLVHDKPRDQCMIIHMISACAVKWSAHDSNVFCAWSVTWSVYDQPPYHFLIATWPVHDRSHGQCMIRHMINPWSDTWFVHDSHVISAWSITWISMCSVTCSVYDHPHYQSMCIQVVSAL